jgi:hypothetical protein
MEPRLTPPKVDSAIGKKPN